MKEKENSRSLIKMSILASILIMIGVAILVFGGAYSYMGGLVVLAAFGYIVYCAQTDGIVIC